MPVESAEGMFRTAGRKGQYQQQCKGGKVAVADWGAGLVVVAMEAAAKVAGGLFCTQICFGLDTVLRCEVSSVMVPCYTKESKQPPRQNERIDTQKEALSSPLVWVVHLGGGGL